jgi:hypothetical protein
MVAMLKPGSDVSMSVVRQRERMDIQLTVGKRPAAPQAPQ